MRTYEYYWIKLDYLEVCMWFLLSPKLGEKNMKITHLFVLVALILGFILLIQCTIAGPCYKNSGTISPGQVNCLAAAALLPGYPCNEMKLVPSDVGPDFCGASVIAKSINVGTTGNLSSDLMSQTYTSQACYEYRICEVGYPIPALPILENLRCVHKQSFDHGDYFSGMKASGGQCPAE
jgi:hypothetical protein